MPVTGTPGGFSDRVRPACNTIVCFTVIRCMITEGHVRKDMSGVDRAGNGTNAYARHFPQKPNYRFRPADFKTKKMQRVSKGMHNPNSVNLHLLFACLRHSEGQQRSEAVLIASEVCPSEAIFIGTAGLAHRQKQRWGRGKQ